MSNENIMAHNKAQACEILKVSIFKLLRHIRYKIVKMKNMGKWAILLITRPVSPGKPASLLIERKMIANI